MIGRLDEVVIDCHDPLHLAEFWQRVLGGYVVLNQKSADDAAANKLGTAGNDISHASHREPLAGRGQ